MAKRDWGAKHTCTGCGAKFYDLHRNPITCPKCDSVIEVATARPIRRRPPAQPKPPPPAKADPAIEAVADETDDDDALVVGIDDTQPIQPEP